MQASTLACKEPDEKLLAVVVWLDGYFSSWEGETQVTVTSTERALPNKNRGERALRLLAEERQPALA